MSTAIYLYIFLSTVGFFHCLYQTPKKWPVKTADKPGSLRDILSASLTSNYRREGNCGWATAAK